MQAFSRHTLSVFALLMYFAGGALIEITHRDEANLLVQSRPVLESHDCGAVEQHMPAESGHLCPACSLSVLRIATPTSFGITLDARRLCVAIVHLHTEQLLDADVFHSGKRGPPFA